MKTLVWDGPNAMHVEQAPDPPDPGRGELILRPEAVGICGSEVEGYLGHMGNRTPPLVMGHEFAGTVVATGDGADELDGARVAVNPLSGCGECRLCRSGHSNLCADRVLVGVHVPGAFADFVKVRAADARVLPDGISARVGALMEPLANGVHAVRLADPGVERAVVVGAGTIGLVTLQAALLHGIPHVAIVEPQPERRERALSLGAHSAEAPPGEADLVLDAVGAQATRAARPRAAAARRHDGLHRARQRRHDARLPRRRAQPAPHPGLLRLHDARLRAGPRMARQRRRRRSATT